MTIDNPDVVVRLGLPEDQRRRAAEITLEAFAHHYRVILSGEHAVNILASAFDPGCAIVALIEGQVVGVAGLHLGKRRLVQWTAAAFIREYGLLSGWIRRQIIRLEYRPQVPGQLLMDGLAVDAAYRGRGVGTALLDGVCAFAREHGYTSVRLDVVDTNPRARALYERLGFTPTETHNVEIIRRFAGFGAYTTMIKAV